MRPDDKEAAVTPAEFRFGVAVQKDVEERWKTRMENEDKIITKAIEVLPSDLNKMSAKMAEDVVCMKNRHQGSAASTVSGSTGKWWQCGQLSIQRCKTLSWLPEFNSKIGIAGDTFEGPAL